MSKISETNALPAAERPYVICSSGGGRYELLAKEVNQYLDKGYVLAGGLFHTEQSGFLQAVVWPVIVQGNAAAVRNV